MGKTDKKHKIAKANLLSESRYLSKKKNISEGLYDSKGNFKGGPNPDDENHEIDEREYEANMRNEYGEFVITYNRSHDEIIVSILGIFKANSGEPITPKSFNNDAEAWDDFYVDAKHAAIKDLQDRDTPDF